VGDSRYARTPAGGKPAFPLPVTTCGEPAPGGTAAPAANTAAASGAVLRTVRAVASSDRTRRTLFRPTGEGHQVTTLELLFDLVFVFALTQVTAFLAEDVSLRQALRGLVLLALLWFAWCSYAWLGNQAKADEGVVRAGMVTAMGAVLVAALALPEAWDDEGGGVSAPLVVAGALAVVRLVHLAVYWVAAGEDHALRRTLSVTAVPVGAAAALLVAGALAGGPAQTALWALALAVDYTGIYVVARRAAWRLPSARHFAERHGLIIIVALGESIVAIGVGIGGRAVTVPVLAAAVLGLAVSVALWWLYFDVVSLVAERVLAGTTGAARADLARDSYTYLHFPMVVGIVYLALGLKKVLEYVADHPLSDPLKGVALAALYGGVTLYLLGHVAFRLRNVGSVNWPRVGVALALLALIPAAAQLPAIAALALLAAVLVGLVAFEAVRYAEARHAIRHAEH
jgi:low temperature requirement protein LtrA